MDTMSNPSSKPLIGKWDLYYHLPHDPNWELTSYKIIMHLETVEEVASISYISEIIIKQCMLFVMRSGIAPMWEDIQNRNGGCFSFKVHNRQVVNVWKHLFYSMCGESLCIHPSHHTLVNGMTISPKKNFCIIKIWMADCSIQDPNIFINIQNLSKQGCIFKKHEPEF